MQRYLQTRKLPFPLTFDPTTYNIWPSFFFSKSHLFSTSSPTVFSLHFFFFWIFSFAVALRHLFLSSLMPATSSPWVKKVASSPWQQWWRQLWFGFEFDFGLGLMGFFVESFILGSKLLEFSVEGLILGLDWFLV